MNSVHARGRIHHLSAVGPAPHTGTPTEHALNDHTLPTPTSRPLSPIIWLGLAGFLSQFDVTALVVALPEIRRQLGLSTAGAAWVIDAYSLAFAGALLPAGLLADSCGRRRILLIGLALFALASAGCALATTGAALWAWRSAQGTGAALLTCATMALLAGIYRRPADHVWAFGWAGTVLGTAMIFGPAGGGWLAASLGWQAIFWLNPPLCFAIFVAGLLGLDEQRGEPASRAGALPVVAGVTSIVGLVWSLLEGGQRGWSHPAVAGPAAIGLLLVVTLLAWVARADRSHYVKPGFIPVSALAGLLSIAYWSTLAVLPSAGSLWFGLNTAQAGVLLLAATGPMLLMPGAGAWLANRWGAKALFAASMALVAAGDLLLWRTAHAPGIAAFVGGMLLAGSGAGLMNSQLSAAFVSTALPSWAGMASALGITMRQLGYALGVALLGAVAGLGSVSYAACFILAAAAGIVGMLLAFALPGTKPGR